MPLNTTQAETDVLALLDQLAANTADPVQARQAFAHQLVSIMATMVRSATITGTVATAGSATQQTGTITTATIS